MAREIKERLNATLRDERAAILAGEYDRLHQFAVDKQAALADLAQTRITRKELSKVKEDFDVNQRLVQAAIGGFAAARARISSIEDARDKLTVYDPSGNVSRVNTAPSNVERKA